MFKEIIAEYSHWQNSSVNIENDINMSLSYIGSHEDIFAAVNVLHKYNHNTNDITQAELISIWSNDTIKFSIKCIITLWYAKVSKTIASKVYSRENIETLNAVQIEKEFKELSSIQSFESFKSRVKSLFLKFETNGEYRLNGVSVHLFSNFFQYFFASHPIASRPYFVFYRVDRWLKTIVYAEMIDCECEDRFTIFNTPKNPSVSIDFRKNNGSIFDSYFQSLIFFNLRIQTLRESFLKFTSIALLDIISNCAKEVSAINLLGDTDSLFLPPWIAGRYNANSKACLLYNNLTGESYLFKDVTSELIGELLNYDYYQPIKIHEIAIRVNCTNYDICTFFIELINQNIIVDHLYSDKEINKIRKETVIRKKEFLKQSNGTQNLQEPFELAETDYRLLIEKQGIPSLVSFELTYGCNEMCIHCYNPGSSREKCIAKKVDNNELSLKDYFSALDQLAEMGVPKVLFTGGDPFIKKDFLKILQYAHKKKFAVLVYTNGQVLYNDKECYKELIHNYPYIVGLSLYSTIPSVHEKITRVKGSCEKTKAVAKKLSEDGIGLLIKCPIMKANANTYSDVYSFAIGINAIPEFDVNITSSADGDQYAIEYLRLNENEMFELLKDPIINLSPMGKDLSKIKPRTAEMHFCGAGIDGMNIQPTGEVTPCLAFSITCGNIKNIKIADIWKNSERINRIRRLTYGDSDKCGQEVYCKYCNRCIGQSYTEKGAPELFSTDNCFIAKIRERIVRTYGETPHQ